MTPVKFIASFVHFGVQGCGLYLNDEGIRCRISKATIEPRYRDFTIPYSEICDLEWRTILFPVLSIRTRDLDSYRFLIFNKNRFQRELQSRNNNAPIG